MSLSLWTLGDIKTKVRKLSGRLDTNDLADSDLVDYINRYYQLGFPLDLQPLELQTWFEFDTVDGTEEYDLTTETDATTSETFEDGYLTIGEPFTADGYNIDVYYNPSLFYMKWPETTTYGEARPSDVLYYAEKLLFRNTPDDAYTIKFSSIKKPAAFANISPTTEYPIQEEWGPVIAYGAAIEVAEDTGDIETVSKLGPRQEELKVRLMRKVHMQGDTVRSIPKFQGDIMAWDATKPADDEKIADLGTVIRPNWVAIAEGTVALTSSRFSATSTPTAVASHGFVYAKDVSSKAELHYADEDSNEVQLTSGGFSLASKVVAKSATDLAITAATNKLITVKTGSTSTHKFAIQDSGGTERFSVTGAGTVAVTGTLAVSGASTFGSTAAITTNATVGGTLGVTGASTFNGDVSVKIGDKGDAAQAVNALIPVAWAYVNANGVTQGSKNMTITGGSGSARTFTWDGYTPADAKYVVIANTNAGGTKCIVTKSTASFVVSAVNIPGGSAAASQILDVVVFDAQEAEWHTRAF